MKSLLIACSLIAFAGPALAEFRLSVSSWGNIPSCTNGWPNTVGNPDLVLRDIPDGTTRIDFSLVDLNVPNYDHGGGRVQISGGGDAIVPAGTFRYRSPCPPGGVHTYEWVATARAGSTVLGRAKAQLRYPQ